MVKGKFLERDRKETQTLCDDNFLFTSSWKILSEKKSLFTASWIVLHLFPIPLHKRSLAQLLIWRPCKVFWNRLSMLFSTQLFFRILLEYLFKLYLHRPTSFSIQSSKASYIPPKPTQLSFSFQQLHIFWYQFLYVSSLLLWWTVWTKATRGEKQLISVNDSKERVYNGMGGIRQPLEDQEAERSHIHS